MQQLQLRAKQPEEFQRGFHRSGPIMRAGFAPRRAGTGIPMVFAVNAGCNGAIRSAIFMIEDSRN